MAQTVPFQRPAVMALVKQEWSQFWIAAPVLGLDALTLLLPHLKRKGGAVRLLTNLATDRLVDGRIDPAAVEALLRLKGFEMRSLPDLSGTILAAGPAGSALVSGATFTLEGLDGAHSSGVWLDEAGPVLADLAAWWEAARPVAEEDWAEIVRRAAMRIDSQRVGHEIAKIGAFVRVSVKGTRRTRRLDPREFGVTDPQWGPSIRPVELALYKLDDVIRAREELEAVLAERGVEWNGQYLLPRTFLEQDWPGIFELRCRQLRERLFSEEGQEGLRLQLRQARQGLETFLGGLVLRADTGELSKEAWIDQQATRVLAEVVSDSILAESGLEYRTLTILPEDERTLQEFHGLLHDPKLRSVQLTFQF